MEYAIIGICVIAVVAICAILLNKSKNKKGAISLSENTTLATSTVGQIDLADGKAQALTIQMEMLPAELIPDESKLMEITDSKVLAHVDSLIPGLTQAGNAAYNVAQAAKANGEVLYRAIIPAGAKLTDSKAMEGAVRGFYRGADGIQGHANLVAAKAQNGTAVVANTAATAMGVASMVVGQYYMAQINSELGEISNGISKIADFQDNEYRSKVFSLIAHVKKIADFQVEILENDELRLSKIAQLDSLEEKCTELIGQANLTLASYAKKKDLDFTIYEKEVKEAQNWYMYQKSLLDVLYKISDLRYTLHLGGVSREQCAALLPTYTKQVADTLERLNSWHHDAAERLNIDIEEVRRKRVGFDGVVHCIPGLFNHDLTYRPIDKNIADMITAQASGHEAAHHQDMTDLYAEDVQLIAKDGKVYYLPESKAE